MVMMMMTRMMLVEQVKRCWVPSGSRGSGGTSANQPRNEKDGEEFAPTKKEPAVAGEFPLPLLIITLPGTKLPREAAILPQSAMMAPDRLVLPSSGPEAGYLSPCPAPRLPVKRLSQGPIMSGLEPGEASLLGNTMTSGSLTMQAGRGHTGQNSLLCSQPGRV